MRCAQEEMWDSLPQAGLRLISPGVLDALAPLHTSR